MILQIGLDLEPAPAAVRGSENQTARADHNGVPLVLYPDTVQRSNLSCVLALPAKTSVPRVENDAIGADGPAVQLVGGKTDGADRVTLR